MGSEIHTYQKVPSGDPEQGSEESKDFYNQYHTSQFPLHNQPLEDEDKYGEHHRRKTIVAKRLLFTGIFILCFMAAFFIRGVFLDGRGAGMRHKCHATMHRLGLAGQHHYHHHHGHGHGHHSNMSTLVGGKLPTHYTLPSGDQIPSVALGVWRADKGLVGEAVKAALKAGYRHIDGAWIYGNEAEVGQAIKESGIARKDIWLTSKLWNSFHAPQDVEPALDESLSRLGTDYLDLYLVHWPVAFVKDGRKNEVDFELTENPYATWQKLEEMVEKGKVRNIGVSNFNVRRLKNLTANPLKIKPAINQVELNFWNPQPDLLQWSKDNNLLLEAYSPLGSEDKVKESLKVPEVLSIAEDLGLTPAQVLISWHVQRGTVVLPKSVHSNRIVENFGVKAIPHDAFERLEKAATSHLPSRSVDPKWGVDIWN